MITLYRTPNVIIGDYEWHATVRLHYGRTSLQYYFRPLSRVRYRWMPITSWKGRKPPIAQRFLTYRRSISIAMHSEQLRADAIKSQPVGVVVRRLAA